MKNNRASKIGRERNHHGLWAVTVLCLAVALGGLAVYGQAPAGPTGGSPTDPPGPPAGPSLGPGNGDLIPPLPPMGQMPSLAPPPGPMPSDPGTPPPSAGPSQGELIPAPPPMGRMPSLTPSPGPMPSNTGTPPPPTADPLRPSDLPPDAVPADQMPSDGKLGGAETVAQVRVTGNSKVPLEKILANIHTHAGRPFNPDIIDEDVRRISKNGQFISVKPFTVRAPQGLIVIFEVIEKPILHYVKYVGSNRIRKGTLASEAKIKPGDAMDPFAVNDARRAIEDYYHSHSFPRAHVTILEGDKPTDRGVIFLIDEGQKQAVFWTDFIGNTIASDARLRTQIKSTAGVLWLFGGSVDRKEIDEDINRLTAYYRGLGFFDCRIGRQLHYNDAQNWLHLTFVVQEGPRYQVRNVSFLGNSKFSTPTLADTVKLKNTTAEKPIYFNQAQMKADVLAIQDLYGGDGYVFCDVKADPRYLEQKGWMDLVYKIQEGERYRVGRINVVIKGDYPHTRINTVLNRLGCIRPGEIADTREMRRAETRLKASQLFEVDPKTGAAPKIAFSPPGLDKSDEEQIADAPGKPAGVRRQSPDGPPPLPAAATPANSAHAAGPKDHTIDVTVEGTWVGGDIPDEPPTWKQGQPQSAPASVPPPPAVQPTAMQPTAMGQLSSPFESDAQGQGEPATTSPSFAVADDRPLPGPRTCLTSYRVERDAPCGDDELDEAAAIFRESLLLRSRSLAQPEKFVVRGYNPDGGDSLPSSGPAWGNGAPAMGSAVPSGAVPSGAAPGAAANAAPVDGLSGPNVSFANQLPPPPGSTLPPSPALGQQVPLTDPALGSAESYSGAPFADAPALPLFPTQIETRTGRFMVSVGVNSDAGLVGSITIDEQNFDWTRWPNSWEDIRDGVAWRGNGEHLQIQLVPGTMLQRYSVTWQNPNIGDSDVGLGLNAYYFQRQYQDWMETWLGGRVSLGYQFAQGLTGSMAYRFAQVDVYDLDADAAPGGKPLRELASAVGHHNYVNGFSLALTNDTRDNAFLATQGHYIEASVEEVVGTFQYPRCQLDARQYFLLTQRPDTSGRQVLSLNGHVGWTGNDTPVYDAFFAGGFSSLRGFEFRGAGPHDNSVSVGGDFEILAGAEYLFPITADDMLRGVLFLDTGTVEPSLTDWSNHYRVAPGFGLRITIPAMGPAPIALDFAFPIALNHGDQVSNFSFFVGFLR